VINLSALCIRHIEDALSGQMIGIATGSILKTHRGWMSTILDGAVYDPDLQFVIKAVPYAAVSDFISTEAGHGSAFFVTALPATEAALLSDERGLATSRAKITRGCYLMKVPIAWDGDLCGLQAQVPIVADHCSQPTA
jgi:hypothetical protein